MPGRLFVIPALVFACAAGWAQAVQRLGGFRETGLNFTAVRQQFVRIPEGAKPISSRTHLVFR